MHLLRLASGVPLGGHSPICEDYSSPCPNIHCPALFLDTALVLRQVFLGSHVKFSSVFLAGRPLAEPKPAPLVVLCKAACSSQ